MSETRINLSQMKNKILDTISSLEYGNVYFPCFYITTNSTHFILYNMYNIPLFTYTREIRKRRKYDVVVYISTTHVCYIYYNCLSTKISLISVLNGSFVLF